MTETAGRGPGRPEIGGAVHLRLGELLDQVDEWARERNISRSAAVRRLISQGLATPKESYQAFLAEYSALRERQTDQSISLDEREAARYAANDMQPQLADVWHEWWRSAPSEPTEEWPGGWLAREGGRLLRPHNAAAWRTEDEARTHHTRGSTRRVGRHERGDGIFWSPFGDSASGATVILDRDYWANMNESEITP